MRTKLEQTDTLATSEIAAKVNFQKAIISAILHNYFQIEPFKEKRSLEQLLFLLNGIGLEAPDKRSTVIFTHFDQGDRALLKNILETALRGATWLLPGNIRRRQLARTTFKIWMDKIYPSTDEERPIAPSAKVQR